MRLQGALARGSNSDFHTCQDLLLLLLLVVVVVGGGMLHDDVRDVLT